MGENTRRVIGGFVTWLLASLKEAATSAVDNAKSSATRKVSHCTRQKENSLERIS